MRCFVAVDLDPELRHKIAVLQKELGGLDTKLVEPQNLHFTLKFLGEVDDRTIAKVEDALRGVAIKYQSFSIDLKDVGVFPNEKFIRVVWIGGEGLAGLQKDVNESLSKLFKKEKPSPHLTLARVRSANHSKEIMGFVNAHRHEKIGTMNVKEIKLKKSTVTSKGPIYEDVEVFNLNFGVFR